MSSSFQKKINPAKTTLIYEFTENECYKKKWGICALDEEPMQEVPGCYQEYEQGYCPSLYIAMKKGIIASTPQIQLCECGHYMVDQGKHRICIAKNKKEEILVEIRTNNLMCINC